MTCKEARVKCNEGRPKCSRCTKHSKECHYQLPVAWIFTSVGVPSAAAKGSKRLTEPGSAESSGQAQVRGASSTFCEVPQQTLPCWMTPQHFDHASPPLTHAVSFYLDAKHAAAVQYFLEVPAPRVAYNKENYFFSIVLPQAIWLHPSIMESMFAMATISAYLGGTSSAAWTDQPPLFHYNKAIGTLARAKPARHIALLVCMLLWLYEQLDNQHARALFHRESATQLLEEWRSCELGKDRTMDDYVVSFIEPVILTGLKVTAPVKLCREALQDPRLLSSTPPGGGQECTYKEALKELGTSIQILVSPYAGEPPSSNKSILRSVLGSLRMWDYQFERYSGPAWAEEGPLLLSYATTVAMVLLSTHLREHTTDGDWHRAAEFLVEEASKGRHPREEEVAHSSLLKGIALITST